MPAALDYTFQKGEDCVIDWTILEEEDGAAADITGWTFSLKVKRNPWDDDPAVATPTNVVIDAATGQLRTTIAAAVSVLMQGAYAYSLWRTNVGAVACQAKGTLTFEDTTEN